MAQISIIKRKDVLKAGRLDAEYFKPEYLEVEKSLKKVEVERLKDFIGSKNIFSGPFGSTLKSESYTTKGVPFIRISDIQSIFIDKTRLVYISNTEHQRLLSTRLNTDDMVLSKIGTIGKMSLITTELGKVNISENNIGIRLDNLKKQEKNLLMFFLLSKYGQKQLLRSSSGNVQMKLNVKDVENLLIPTKVNPIYYQNTYKKLIEKQKKAECLYEEAEEILLKELDLIGYTPEHSLYFETKEKEVKNSERFDAEYFQPKYEDIVKKIEKYRGGFGSVKDIAEWKKGVEVGSEAYTDTGKEFVRVSDFSEHGIGSASKKISKNLFQTIKNDFQPKKGEILFTKDGTVGISHVLKEEIEGVLSGAFLRISLKKGHEKIEKECLSLIFNSVICKMQIEQLSGGAIINHLKPSDFEKLKIPLIDKKIQRKIAEKIQESYKLKKESKELLESAKERIEKEIDERGGK